MNGAHDMGGMHGFGPVMPEKNEPLFRFPWEAKVMSLTIAMGATGAWNLDMSRHARENRSPRDYLNKTYYELWLAGVETLIVETGLATPEEIATGKMAGPATPIPRLLTADITPGVLAKGAATARAVGFAARFKVGAEVVTKELDPPTHIRLPRYVRGKKGVIHAVHGAHVFPDANAHGHGEAPHFLYTVKFEAHEVWGPDTSAAELFVDCWEPYLEAPA